jgi:hypothetical protein
VKYFKKKRDLSTGDLGDNDPMSGVANLFDIGLVFIVALIVTLFSVYRLDDLFNEKSELTIMKKNENGEMEIITKKGKKIKAIKISKDKAKGRGEKLGIAYRLEDGSMVYVPEKG